jgi:L-seryl-tRNA(Ser) seleniumtransferase
MVGGGSLPDHTLPSIVVVIKPKDSAENLARRLRLSTPAVIGRIEQDGFLIDMRTVLPSLDNMLIEVIKGAFT